MYVSTKTLAVFAIMAAVLAPAFATVSESDFATNAVAETRPSESFQEDAANAIRTMEDAPHRKLMGGVTYYCCCSSCLGGTTIYNYQSCDPGTPKVYGACNPITCQNHRSCWNNR